LRRNGDRSREVTGTRSARRGPPPRRPTGRSD